MHLNSFNICLWYLLGMFTLSNWIWCTCGRIFGFVIVYNTFLANIQCLQVKLFANPYFLNTFPEIELVAGSLFMLFLCSGGPPQ